MNLSVPDAICAGLTNMPSMTVPIGRAPLRAAAEVLNLCAVDLPSRIAHPTAGTTILFLVRVRIRFKNDFHGSGWHAFCSGGCNSMMLPFASLSLRGKFAPASPLPAGCRP